MNTAPWLFVVFGGVVLLGLALAYAQVQSRRRNREVDPDTPDDDPSKGL